MLLVYLQTFLTEHLSTAVDLLWVSGHTQADQAEEVIRRGLHKLMVIAFQISNIGCHDMFLTTVFIRIVAAATINFSLAGY